MTCLRAVIAAPPVDDVAAVGPAQAEPRRAACRRRRSGGGRRPAACRAGTTPSTMASRSWPITPGRSRNPSRPPARHSQQLRRPAPPACR